jgi:hypothetical protein
MEAFMNYDPNLNFCGRMTTQTVRLTFAVWEYRKTVEVTVGGNCRGFNVIEQAVENVYDKLPNAPHASESKNMILTDESGDELDCDEDEGDWLKNMLLSAEIIDIQPEKETE